MNIKDFAKNQKQFKELITSNILQVVEESLIGSNLNGEIIFWNKGAEKLFGYGQTEVLGRQLAFLYPEKGEKILKSDLENILKGKDYIGEWKGKRKDGTIVWVKIKTTCLLDDKGKAIGFIGISHDITEQKHTLKELY